MIEDAQKASARIIRINKNLLMLTKIENSQFMEKEKINLSELLHQTLILFSSFINDKHLYSKKEIKSDVIVEGNLLLVEIVLNNLITNDIRYSPANGVISLELYGNQLVISNAGTVALNQEQLFKRFGNTATHTPGTGLGLALVKHVCQRYGWDISYRFSNMLHIFTLSF